MRLPDMPQSARDAANFVRPLQPVRRKQVSLGEPAAFRQLLSNDRSHALIEASGRDSLRLVPEVAMAAAAESLLPLGVVDWAIAPAGGCLGCINRHGLLL